MKFRISRTIENIRHNRTMLAAFVTALALMVAVGTTYALISPASTMETPEEEQITEEISGSEAIEVNENGLTADEQACVDRVIGLIDALPIYEQFDAQILAYENEEDLEAMETYYADVMNDVMTAKNAYAALDEKLQGYVTNYDKLQELDGMAAAQVMTSAIESDSPSSVTTATTGDFIELNLYDYGSNINDKYRENKNYPGFQWNGGAYNKSGDTYNRHKVDFIDFGNSLITDLNYGTKSGNGLSPNCVKVGNNGGAINALDVSDYGVTNRPIGMSLADGINDKSKDVLSRTLINGYPALKDGSSLDYLFKDGTYAKKKNTETIDGLFQKNQTSGEYYYNSRENHAQYKNNRFTVYNQIITPNFIVYPFGNFLPLNDITDNDATQVSKITQIDDYVQAIINDLCYSADYEGNTSKQQLVEMLALYRTSLQGVSVSNGSAWTQWNGKNAIVDYFTSGNGDNPSDNTDLITDPLLSKMYNIDWDVKTNFFFGMEMKMNFIQPKGGMTGNDTNNDGKSDYPMEFYFTGDDDVWVYIDDVLFLDLSGIHRHVGGKIDFVNGKVYYYHLDTAGTGDVSDKPYKTFTFNQILNAAGKNTDCLNSEGTFRNYTSHKFNFYYMERGSGSSVCRLNFNFPLIKQNSISVAKEVTSDSNTLGNPDFKFQVMAADSGGKKTDNLFIGANTEYTIYNNNNERVGTGTTDSNGVFTLKAGQRAEFAGINENRGKYYVRELLEPEFVRQYDQITVSGESTTIQNNVTVGQDQFTGAESKVKDSSDGTTVFQFTNNLDKSELGSMEIKKVLKANVKKDSFNFEVTLDGELLPVGTNYTVTDKDDKSSSKKVTTEGQITLGSGETAKIEGIKAGTQFTVKETAESSKGYEVIYGGTNVTVGNDCASGRVTADSAKDEANNSIRTLVKVINTDGTVVDIPVQKTINNPNSQRTFNFVLQQTDAEGNVLEDKDPQNLQITMNENGAMVDSEGKEVNPQFSIVYPIGTVPGVYYYQVKETAAEDSLIEYDDTVYRVKVTVSRDEDGALTAIPTIYKNGVGVTGITFTNIQLYSLSIKKEVPDVDDNNEFKFNVNLMNADGKPLTGTLSWTKNGQDNELNFEEKQITVDGTEKTVGQASITLKDGETATIVGLPAGTVWWVTEGGSKSDGYVAKYKINVTTELTKGLTAGSTIQSGSIDNSVTFVNEPCYMLPETGGIGTKPFYIGGFLLIALGTVMMIRQNRRKA